MPFYADADKFYAIITELFARIEREAPQAIAGLMRANLVVRFKVTHPVAEILLSGHRAKFQITCGPSRSIADLDAHLSGDTMHRIFLGETTLAHALNAGQLRVQGNIFRALQLAELFQAAKHIYPQLLIERGLLKK